MRPIALKTLTWATVAAAVASAVWLAAVEAEHGFALRLAASPAAARPSAWPAGPRAAGTVSRRHAAAAAPGRQVPAH